MNPFISSAATVGSAAQSRSSLARAPAPAGATAGGSTVRPVVRPACLPPLVARAASSQVQARAGSPVCAQNSPVSPVFSPVSPACSPVPPVHFTIGPDTPEVSCAPTQETPLERMGSQQDSLASVCSPGQGVSGELVAEEARQGPVATIDHPAGLPPLPCGRPSQVGEGSPAASLEPPARFTIAPGAHGHGPSENSGQEKQVAQQAQQAEEESRFSKYGLPYARFPHSAQVLFENYKRNPGPEQEAALVLELAALSAQDCPVISQGAERLAFEQPSTLVELQTVVMSRIQCLLNSFPNGEYKSYLLALQVGWLFEDCQKIKALSQLKEAGSSLSEQNLVKIAIFSGGLTADYILYQHGAGLTLASVLDIACIQPWSVIRTLQRANSAAALAGIESVPRQHPGLDRLWQSVCQACQSLRFASGAAPVPAVGYALQRLVQHPDLAAESMGLQSCLEGGAAWVALLYQVLSRYPELMTRERLQTVLANPELGVLLIRSRCVEIVERVGTQAIFEAMGIYSKRHPRHSIMLIRSMPHLAMAAMLRDEAARVAMIRGSRPAHRVVTGVAPLAVTSGAEGQKQETWKQEGQKK